MRLVKKILLYTLLALVLYIGGFLLYGTLTDWQPEGTEPALTVMPETPTTNLPDSLIRLVTWNVGYGGIGDEDFFFYNKGDFFWTEPGTVRMARPRVQSNVEGQGLTLRSTLADIFLLQEVDTAARRSHYLNQWAGAREARPAYYASFAPNFVSGRVPLPIFQPWDHYGDVVGGLVSLSRYPVSTAERIQLPGEHPWPTKLFQLDRCALRTVIPTATGKNLVVYNVHLSAYDKGGNMRRQQLDAIRAAVLADYERGDYAIVGGDWNQLPPGFNWFSLNPTVERIEPPQRVGHDYLPAGWNYAYDAGVATVRESAAPYNDHTTRKSLIDFFVTSPNLRLRAVKGINQRFKFSDHQPVYLEVELL